MLLANIITESKSDCNRHFLETKCAALSWGRNPAQLEGEPAKALRNDMENWYMITNIEKMTYDEVRNSLILAKELLRGLSDRAPDVFCFESYTGAYLAIADAITTLTQVQVISAEDDFTVEEQE